MAHTTLLVVSCHGLFICKMAISVDPDQLASQYWIDLDLHCFLNRIYLGILSEGLILVLLNVDLSFFENTVDSDQLDSNEAS